MPRKNLFLRNASKFLRKEAAEYRAAMNELGQRQQVSIKLSGW
jgi:hypothetical protein